MVIFPPKTGTAAKWLLCTGLFASCAWAAGPTHADDVEFFEKNVRPLLAQHCWSCHGPEKQKSGLRLDHIDYIREGGNSGRVMDFDAPGQSRLLAAIRHTDPELTMPPTGKLPDLAVEALQQWIMQGAAWPDEALPDDTAEPSGTFDVEALARMHWAWYPVASPEPPAVSTPDWPATPVDNFVLAKLEAADLAPAPDTDRRTLIRRLYFDLIGLPPTPAQVEAFLEDERPDAYERVVDELLASPHFGERWGRHWLDITRFAETYGHEQDYPVEHAWKYRDYVIRALNDDVPYDDFVIEHLAGDLLDAPRINPETQTNESILGTGFWFMHQATHGPVDVAQDESDRVDNQIDVFSKAFLGMTVSCARCHDHKFDAISKEDYYALSGIFQSSREQFAFLDPGGQIARSAKRIADVANEGRNVLARGLEAFSRGPNATVAEYLLAAQEVRFGAWTPEDGDTLLHADIPYDDFESDHPKFRDRSGAMEIAEAESIKKNIRQLRGYRGAKFLSSYNPGGAKTGVATSSLFEIERRYIRFRVAGALESGSGGVFLIIGGLPVRSAVAHSEEQFTEVVWDVEEFRGQRAVLVVEDDDENDGAYISADAFEFAEFLYDEPIRRNVATVAAERGLDAERLEHWVTALQAPETNEPAHPLYPWKALENASDDGLAEAIDQFLAEESSRLSAYDTATADNVVFETFDDGDYDGWFRTGEAFLERPAMAGDWRADHHATAIPRAGAAHSGLLDDALQGVLRSPTFTISHDNIHIRMAGRNAKIRLVVEGYQLVEYNGLLFGRTLVHVNSGENFVWHNMTRDLSKFKGREAYFELIDEGDGFVAVDEIRFSNGEPAGDAPWAATTDFLANGGIDSRDALAAHYAEEVGALARDWARNALAPDDGLAECCLRPASASRGELLSWMLDRGLVDVGPSWDALAELAAEKDALAARTPQPERALAMVDGTPEDERVYLRGDYKNLGEEVPRRFLEAIAGDDQNPIQRGSGRLQLAKRLLDPQNPLPARVFVNRAWHHLFGVGIVPSVDNFGVLGEVPTHPLLLDFLATRFMENGWSIKGIVKDLCMTRAYRMRSDITDQVAEERDPKNALLHRMRVKRLEAEAVRDNVLAVAGTLNDAMYGPSVPAHLSEFMSKSRRPPRSGPMDGDRRRTIYMEVRRNFLSPMLLAFDLPVPESAVGKRTVSNVPAQALILMNDAFVVQQAEALGNQIAAMEGSTTDDQINTIYLRALGRPVESDELEAIHGFLAQQAAEYGLAGEGAYADPRIWTDLAHVVFTLKEFIFIG